MMKRFLVLLLAATFIPLLGLTASSDPPEKDLTKPPAARLSPLMQMKLDKSKLILEGLTLEDYEKIGKNARALRLLSTESSWNVIQTKEYATQSRDVQRTCDLISEAAREKAISRAALGYVAMTVRCVECHAYMRKYKEQQPKSK